MLVAQLQPAFAKTIKSDDNAILTGGWYQWDPYQYTTTVDGFETFTGLDIQLSKTIAAKADATITFESVPWQQHILDIKNGKRDIAAGATYTAERAEFAYFSEPYRYEENSLFVPRDKISNYKFTSIAELLSTISKNNMRLGITEGFIYADPKLNEWIAEPRNKQYIISAQNDFENLESLLEGRINFFIADKIVGATTIWRMNAGKEVAEINLNLKAPIHFMFSKKTISPQFVDKFNLAIKEVKNSDSYTRIVSGYLYPVLLLQTADTSWFRTIELIGIVAFAISGLVIAYQVNATIFGAFLLAMLPSLGGGMIRDILFSRKPVAATANPSYLMMIIATVLVVYVVLAIYRRYSNLVTAHYLSNYRKYLNATVEICDGLGLAAFSVIGIIVALMVQAQPLWLWGPFCAFLTGAAGGFLRDLLSKPLALSAIKGESIYPEIAIIWGFLLSAGLTIHSRNYNPDTIQYMVIFTVIGAFLSRMIVVYYKIPNLSFNGSKADRS